jgi:hypothetical protein
VQSSTQAMGTEFVDYSALQPGRPEMRLAIKGKDLRRGHRRRSLEVNKKKPLSRVLLTVLRIVKCEWLNPPLKVTLGANLQRDRVLILELVDRGRLRCTR